MGAKLQFVGIVNLDFRCIFKPGISLQLFLVYTVYRLVSIVVFNIYPGYLTKFAPFIAYRKWLVSQHLLFAVYVCV